MSRDLSALRARVEEAKGPDRALDAALADLLWPESGGLPDYTPGNGSPKFTADLNAALGLVEAKLPGWGYNIDWQRRGSDGLKWAFVKMHDDLPLRKPDGTAECSPVREAWAGGHTPALALLSALLSALETQ